MDEKVIKEKIEQLNKKIDYLTTRIEETGNKNEVLKWKKRGLELYKIKLESKLKESDIK